MPSRHRWRSAYLCAFFILLTLVFVLSFNPPRMRASSSTENISSAQARLQQQIRQLDQDLRNPHLLFLRGGSFDPLEGEPAAVRVGQAKLESTNLTARSERLAATAAGQAST